MSRFKTLSERFSELTPQRQTAPHPGVQVHSIREKPFNPYLADLDRSTSPQAAVGPRGLGVYEGEPVHLSHGPSGPYLGWKGDAYFCDEVHPPETIHHAIAIIRRHLLATGEAVDEPPRPPHHRPTPTPTRVDWPHELFGRLALVDPALLARVRAYLEPLVIAVILVLSLAVLAAKSYGAYGLSNDSCPRTRTWFSVATLLDIGTAGLYLLLLKRLHDVNRAFLVYQNVPDSSALDDLAFSPAEVRRINAIRSYAEPHSLGFRTAACVVLVVGALMFAWWINGAVLFLGSPEGLKTTTSAAAVDAAIKVEHAFGIGIGGRMAGTPLQHCAAAHTLGWWLIVVVPLVSLLVSAAAGFL